jgi:hypothetical protein
VLLVRPVGKLQLPDRLHSCYHQPMARSTGDNTKKRAAQTGTLIGVRLQPDQLAPVDAWIGQQADLPTRPEAIRRLIELGLEATKKTT